MNCLLIADLEILNKLFHASTVTLLQKHIKYTQYQKKIPLLRSNIDSASSICIKF